MSNSLTIAEEIELIDAFDKLSADIHHNALEKGFWDNEIHEGLFAKLLLIHAELSEALEALRCGNLEDKHLKGFQSFHVEMADAFIRIIDFCAGYGIDLMPIVISKHKFNKTRPHKHGKAF